MDPSTRIAIYEKLKQFENLKYKPSIPQIKEYTSSTSNYSELNFDQRGNHHGSSVQTSSMASSYGNSYAGLTYIAHIIWIILYDLYNIDTYIDPLLWFRSLNPIEKLYLRGFSKGSLTIILC